MEKTDLQQRRQIFSVEAVLQNVHVFRNLKVFLPHRRLVATPTSAETQEILCRLYISI